MKLLFPFMKKKESNHAWIREEFNQWKSYIEATIFILMFIGFFLEQYLVILLCVSIIVSIYINERLFEYAVSSIKGRPLKTRSFHQKNEIFPIQLYLQNDSKLSIRLTILFFVSNNVKPLGYKFYKDAEKTEIFVDDVLLVPGLNTVKVQVEALARGEVLLSDLSIIVQNPSGIESRKFKYRYPLPKNHFIYPKAKHPDNRLSTQFTIQEGNPNQLGVLQDSTMLIGYRDYTYQDSMKSIDWKATAKVNKFQVKQYEHTVKNSVYFVVDISEGYGLHVGIEDFLSILTGYIQQAESLGYQYGFAINSYSYSTLFCELEIGNGIDHREKALALIASIPSFPNVIPLSKVLSRVCRYESEVMEWIHIGSKSDKTASYYKKLLPNHSVKWGATTNINY